MSAHPLKIHHHPAKRPSQRPPLLFVHGGYTNARCWEHNFIPYFQQKGYDCHALDLSGHGESGGGQQEASARGSALMVHVLLRLFGDRRQSRRRSASSHPGAGAPGFNGPAFRPGR